MTNFSLKTRIYSGGLMSFYVILSLFIKTKNQKQTITNNNNWVYYWDVTRSNRNT